jgi:DNA-binding GntR family transcriptional regulator
LIAPRSAVGKIRETPLMNISPLVQKIVNDLRQKILVGDIEPEAHLNTQNIADRFSVSRSPAREALNILREQGFVEQRKNRGFFVIEQEKQIFKDDNEILYQEDSAEYYQLAEDWLQDELPAEVTELYLRKRYGLTKLQVIEMLNKAARVGWAEAKPGYGWRFLEVAKTPEALEQIYRLRSLLEPAALLEPTFRIIPEVLAGMRKAQEDLLSGDVENKPANVLMKAGVDFHEGLMKFSGNPYYHMFIVQLNNMRKLIEYRSMIDRKRLFRQCSEHLKLIELLENHENLEAAHMLKSHLSGAFRDKSPILQSKYEYKKSVESL